MNDALPALDRPLGSLDFRIRRTGVADETPFAPVGRRVRAEGTGSTGLDGLWAGDARVLRTLRVDGASAREVMETPLGVERRLVLGTARLVERVVAHHDAPVAWVEWVRETGGEPGLALEIIWRTGLDAPGTSRPAAMEPPRWERHDRGLVVHRDDPAARAFFIFGTAPSELTVETDDGELLVRARCTVPDSGLRMAVVGVGPDDDADRLLRIAGRTRVAVRGREGGANRLLDDGLAITTPEPALDRAVEAARLHLDAAGLPPGPGPWRTGDAVRAALAHLMVGEFGAVQRFLPRLARTAVDGRVPDRVLDDRAISHDRGRAGLLFLLLTARYLAWSGDLRGARGLWPAVESVLRAQSAAGWPAGGARGAQGAGAQGPAGAGLRDVALGALAVAAEAIGEDETATELREVAGEGSGREGSRRSGSEAEVGGGSGPGPAAGAGAAADPAGVLLSQVAGLLAPAPDAVRGRLELRPCPPEGWDRFEVRGLTVGSAAIDVVYRRDGGLHRFEVEQTRGPAPVQAVLAPELVGGAEVVTRVDGKPATLDVESADGRVRVPVQLVLDHLRMLEVEFGDDTP